MFQCTRMLEEWQQAETIRKYIIVSSDLCAKVPNQFVQSFGKMKLKIFQH